VFTLWDRLFGTYCAAPTAGYDAMQLGLKEIRDDRAWDLWWQIKSPALRIKRESGQDDALGGRLYQGKRDGIERSR